jgi:hypothetical protein
VAAEAILELSGRLQSEASDLPTSSGSGSSARDKRQEETEADLRFRNHLLRRELERTKERIAQLGQDSCAAVLGQELVMVPGGTHASEASQQRIRRPNTAAVRSVPLTASTESGQTSKDLDDLLQKNEHSLQQLTGQLRKTELVMGQQRPMTTGHLQRAGMSCAE